MSELINREDVQREIQSSFNLGAFRWQDGQDLMDRINALPIIDAVPVVRCKDCDNWSTKFSSGRKSLGNYRCLCQEWSDAEDHRYVYTGENEYCSKGERR